MVAQSFLDRHLLAESVNGVVSIYLLQLHWGVDVQELVEGQKSSSYSDCDLVSITLDIDPLGTELVHSLTFSQEHYSQLAPLWIVVDVLCQLSIHWVFLFRYVYLVPCSHGLNIPLHSVDLLVLLLKSVKQVLDLSLGLILPKCSNI